MKKIIVVVAAVVVLAAGVFGLIVFQQSRKEFSIEDVLPAKPIFYLRADNLAQRADSFSKTKLFQALKELDYQSMFSAAGAPLEALTQVRDVGVKVFSEENQKIFKTLFGLQAAVAVYYDPGLDDLKTQTPQQIAQAFRDSISNVMVVTKLTPEAVAAEVVTKFFLRFNKDLKTRSVRYNGQEIHLVESPDGKAGFCYARFNNVVFIGFNEKAARTAIDVVAKKQKSLKTDDDFQKRAATAYSDNQTFGYFDIKALVPILTKELMDNSGSDQASAPAKTQLEEQVKQIKGLDALLFSNKPGEFINYKFDLLFEAAALSPEMKIFYTCSPQDNRSTEFVPWDALVYQWNNCLDLGQMWSQYQQQAAKAAGRDIDIKGMTRMYEKMMGVTIEGDILPAIGQEFGLYLTDVDLNGAIPMPKIVLFVETTDRDRGDALINKLLALQPALQVEELKHQGETIRFIPIPLIESLSIGYTYVGNTLLLGSSVDVLKSSLDAAKDPGKSIAHIVSLKSFTGPKNSVFYVQTDRLFQKAQAVLDWSVETAKQSQVQREAFLTGSQKKLADLRERDEELQGLIRDRQASVTQLSSLPADPLVDQAGQLEEAKKSLLEVQNELAANHEKEKSLSEQVDFYQNRSPKLNAQQEAAQQFLKPILQALVNLKYLNVTTVNGDGVIGSTVSMKIE